MKKLLSSYMLWIILGVGALSFGAGWFAKPAVHPETFGLALEGVRIEMTIEQARVLDLLVKRLKDGDVEGTIKRAELIIEDLKREIGEHTSNPFIRVGREAAEKLGVSFEKPNVGRGRQ